MLHVRQVTSSTRPVHLRARGRRDAGTAAPPPFHLRTSGPSRRERDQSLLVRSDVSELMGVLSACARSSCEPSHSVSQPCCLRLHCPETPGPTRKLASLQRTASESAPVSKHDEISPPPPPHPPAHPPTSRLRAPTRTAINMAPSFEQLDPEQAEYDGEEDIDFSGTPARTHNAPDACAEERRC